MEELVNVYIFQYNEPPTNYTSHQFNKISLTDLIANSVITVCEDTKPPSICNLCSNCVRVEYPEKVKEMWAYQAMIIGEAWPGVAVRLTIQAVDNNFQGR